MSHGKERTGKNCLNCNAVVMGRYCQVCGQENVEPEEIVWHLVTHFFYDITHFDSKFFDTLKYLILRPGFLSGEYARGRRASYLNPIRMYVFTSAVFFIIFFSMFNAEEFDFGSENSASKLNEQNIATYKKEAYKKAKTKQDSLDIEKGFGIIGNFVPAGNQESTNDSAKEKKFKGAIRWNDDLANYSSVAKYDSVQNSLSTNKKHGWIKRLLYRKFIGVNEKYKDDKPALAKDIFEKFMHTFPYLLFVSLPLYAFFLKLLYWRKRMYLTQHGIFLVHLYIFTFLVLLVYFGLSAIVDSLHWDWLFGIQVVLILYGIWYAYKALRNFYEQGWAKTILKFILLNIMAISTLIILFVAFLAMSIFQL